MCWPRGLHRVVAEVTAVELEQATWTDARGWEPGPPGRLGDSADLVLAFGSPRLLKEQERFPDLRARFPRAYLFGCSTAGEICDTRVTDDSLVATAVRFSSTHVKGARIAMSGTAGSFEAGRRLAQALDTRGLIHAVVLSDGIQVNGSDLVRGLTQHLPPQVTVTGGLSGDGDRFSETLVVGDAPPETGAAAIVGFYGDRLRVGYGSLGGWDPFGPERVVTRSAGNVLYELDGDSALKLYKRYLGEHAEGLPGSGLLFPLSLRRNDDGPGVVRTILSVNEADQSMTFAGEIPQGSYARLMKANFDRLIDGASGAVKTSYEAVGSQTPDLALLISCVGRKMVLKQRIEEEIEGVRDVLGSGAVLTGFYSYGEISPFTPDAKCALHNQTMTITTFAEH